MPTYDYECNACGHRFEKFQPITSRPIRKCPQCGKSAARRRIGAGAGVIFRGSGFYQTDYRSESYRKAAETEGKSSSSSADKPASPSGGPAKKGGSGGKGSKGESSGGD